MRHYFRTFKAEDEIPYELPMHRNFFGFKTMNQRELQGRLVGGIRYAWTAQSEQTGLIFVVYADGDTSKDLWNCMFKRKVPLKEKDVYLWGSSPEDD